MGSISRDPGFIEVKKIEESEASEEQQTQDNSAKEWEVCPALILLSVYMLVSVSFVSICTIFDSLVFAPVVVSLLSVFVFQVSGSVLIVFLSYMHFIAPIIL